MSLEKSTNGPFRLTITELGTWSIENNTHILSYFIVLQLILSTKYLHVGMSLNLYNKFSCLSVTVPASRYLCIVSTYLPTYLLQFQITFF